MQGIDLVIYLQNGKIKNIILGNALNSTLYMF